MFKLAALAVLVVVSAAWAGPVMVEERSAMVDSGTGAAVTSTVMQQRSGGNFAYSVHESRQYPAPLVPVPAPIVPAVPVQAPVVPVPVQVPGLQYALPQTIVPGAGPAVIAAPYGHVPIQKV